MAEFDSWESIGKHVIITLDKMDTKLDSLESKINESTLDTQVEITTLKVKAAIWGTVAGVIASAIVSILVGYIVYGLTKHPDYKKYEDYPYKPNKQVERPVENSYLTPRDNERIFSSIDDGGVDT